MDHQTAIVTGTVQAAMLTNILLELIMVESMIMDLLVKRKMMV
jgi:hypothetical protein